MEDWRSGALSLLPHVPESHRASIKKALDETHLGILLEDSVFMLNGVGYEKDFTIAPILGTTDFIGQWSKLKDMQFETIYFPDMQTLICNNQPRFSQTWKGILVLPEVYRYVESSDNFNDDALNLLTLTKANEFRNSVLYSVGGVRYQILLKRCAKLIAEGPRSTLAMPKEMPSVREDLSIIFNISAPPEEIHSQDVVFWIHCAFTWIDDNLPRQERMSAKSAYINRVYQISRMSELP